MQRQRDAAGRNMRYEFSNDYHKTTASVPSGDGKLTVRVVDRLKLRLCKGDSECPCSGTGGVRGLQKWKLVDKPGGAGTIMRANEASKRALSE